MHVSERVGQEPERTRSKLAKVNSKWGQSPELSWEVQEKLLVARRG